MADVSTSQPWAATSAWSGIAAVGHIGAQGTGVTAELSHSPSLATLMIGEGGEAPLDTALRGSVGTGIPAPNRAVFANGITIVSTGPSQYLLVDEQGSIVRQEDLASVAAIARQDGGRALLHLHGPRARELLAKGVMVDLHPAAFPVGAVAATAISHVPVLLWRQDDRAEGPAFTLAIARSLTGSFWSWLSASAAEFGCAVRDHEIGRQT